MINSENQVVLTINFRGTQISRGSYEFYKTKTKDGVKEGINIEKFPQFGKVSKQLTLKERFVEGALISPPESMKLSVSKWSQISDTEKLKIHIERYVKDMYPERIDYSFEII